MIADDLKKLEQTGARLTKGLQSRSLYNASQSLRLWKEFCVESHVERLQSCDSTVAIAWINWLQARGNASQTIRQLGMFPLHCIELLKQLEPNAVSPDFVLPSAHIPVPKGGYRGMVLSEAQLKGIITACIEDIAGAKEMTALALVPFLALFCVRTGMNVESALRLPRNCTVPHPEKTGMWVLWQKRRSKGAMRDYYEPLPLGWGALEIIAFLQSHTQGPFLFSNKKRDGWVPFRSHVELLPVWRARHGIAPFTLASIRPAMATLLYRLSNGNAMKVKKFLHHENLQTTLLYLSANIARPLHEKVLAEAQEAMFAGWGVGAKGSA